MIIGDESKLIYRDGSNAVFDIHSLPKDKKSMVEGEFYIIDNLIYEYIGKVNDTTEDDIPVGCFGIYIDRLLINTIPEDDEMYNDRCINMIIDRTDYEEERSSMDKLIETYVSRFKDGSNIVKELESKLKNSGDVYIPVIKDTDDVLTRMMKLMIIDKEVILSNYKNNSEGTKDYSIDNLRSALNGTTVNMTITKFLSWCSLLGLKWKFEIFDDPDIDNIQNPLGTRLTISDEKDLWVDVGEKENGIFKVPLSENDDPLKKLIKIAVYMKRMVLTDYKDKGSTPHLLNNMRSALKRSSKMMITYFVFWCEILDITYNFELYDPVTGITHCGNKHYKARDYIESEE